MEAGVHGPWERSPNGGPVGSEHSGTGLPTGLGRGTEMRLRRTRLCGVSTEEARPALIFKQTMRQGEGTWLPKAASLQESLGKPVTSEKAVTMITSPKAFS